MINNRQNGRRRGRGGQRPQGNPGAPGGGNRIDNRARGNAQQLHEKYKNLARDSQMAGDRVTTEYYLQFADHYFRVLSESRARFEDQRRPSDDEFEGEEGDEFDQRDPRDTRDQRDHQPREQREPREPRGDRGNGRDRGNYRRDDERRERQPEANYAEGGEAAEQHDNEGERRPRRARRPREDGSQFEAANEGFDANILPPAIAPAVEEGEAQAPRRRTRRPRAETANDTVEVPPAA